MSEIHEHIFHEQETGSFNLALRVLGNELLGFSVSADSFSTKWVILGTIITVAMTGVAATFGPDLIALFS